MEILTRTKILEMLHNHYSSRLVVDRKLIETESYSGNGSLGCILFALEGTPPKGYAIYCPELHKCWFYDFEGRRFRILREISLEEGK